MSGADTLSSFPPFPVLLCPKPLDEPIFLDHFPTLCPPCTGLEHQPSITITMGHPWPKDDVLFLTELSFNVQLYCGQQHEGGRRCGPITGPSCAGCRAAHGLSIIMTTWNYSPKEAEASIPRVIELTGLHADEQGRIKVHVNVQQVCLWLHVPIMLSFTPSSLSLSETSNFSSVLPLPACFSPCT
jgi:hypothetical protein